ncbi:Cell division protein FtsH [hydrothermal vent metagenome]|uniref:Cell division protein FtsH n=1 Tax=hydrothermal vent metagenome TaxID=652676 RepID=A0A3B0R9Z9_9ZZZZ
MGRNIALWAIIVILLLTLYSALNGGAREENSVEIDFSTFLDKVEAGQVAKVTIKGKDIAGEYGTGASGKFHTYAPEYPNLVADLRGKGVMITSVPEETSSFLNVFLGWLPMILLIGVWIYFMRQMQGGGNKAMGFGKSKAKMLNEAHGRVTFSDVAGIDEAKEDLEEIVEFLQDSQKFERLGGTIPKGALLVGPPGTGKTLLARAIAGEANVPFFTISGSDFVEMFVGVGASRVRDMFEQAKKNAPCIIFIDEIDAVGRHRGAGLGGGNDEREQTLNQLLVEMDGFEANEGVILVAATNRPDVLDPALLRPGRFDRQVVVPMPDIVGREKILQVHLKKTPKLAADVNVRTIARGTPGFSGADLANLVNEGALLAARKGKRVISMEDFEEAKDKVMMGAERRSMVMTEEEKRMTAFHEAGHALVAVKCPASDPIHKATIIPRGRALGMVMRLPERDSYSYARDKMHDDLAVAMGGRVAEEICFGYDKVSSGASGDIAMATKLARAMVTKWGMSDKLGMLQYGDNQEEVFLGHSVARSHDISDETAKLIDEEVRRLVDESYGRAKKICTDHRDILDKLGNALLEYETLTGEDIGNIVAGKDIHRDLSDDDNSSDTPHAGSVPSSGSKPDNDKGTNIGSDPVPEN